MMQQATLYFEVFAFVLKAVWRSFDLKLVRLETCKVSKPHFNCDLCSALRVSGSQSVSIFIAENDLSQCARFVHVPSQLRHN